MFVEGIRAALAGDLATLQRFCTVKLEGEKNKWLLTLVPVDDDAREVIQYIHITGENSRMTAIKIGESTGDYSIMVITRGAE